ncbi:helix-turn-helix domain-containing protein [Mucilaginibacter sp. UYCu711]|uniref:AraC family transcriptional regulator n=1 Tax=Mucilaginibacter sp. UYCu711 TaxID=3156339 RepID=UPI003D25D809
MKVSNLKPNGSVAEYVERILVIDDHQVSSPFALPLFANGTPTLLFISKKGIIKGSPVNHLLLFGQTISPEFLTFTEDFTLIAYFFKPFALLSLFGVSAQELTDRIIDINLVSPQITKELQERLLNADSAVDMLVLIDNYIAKLASQQKSDCAIIKYATQKIITSPGKEVLLQLQKELNITERTFQRTFERNVGLAPNLYRRVCQFNAAFQQLNNSRDVRLTDIAFQHGYADQSHFIRSFKEFTNLTPKQYLNY